MAKTVIPPSGSQPITTPQQPSEPTVKPLDPPKTEIRPTGERGSLFTSDFKQPGVVRPNAKGELYLLPKDQQQHWFSSAAHLDNAMAIEFMDPAQPAVAAKVEGGVGGDIKNMNGDVVHAAKSNGAFGGPILEMRVGQHITETIDASLVHEPIVLHKHGTHPKNSAQQGETAGMAANNSDMTPLFAGGPAVDAEFEPGVGGRKDITVKYDIGGRARTRAEHSHTHGFNVSLVADQVRRGLIAPMIIRDKTSDALERAGLPSQLGVDDLMMVLQDEQAPKNSDKIKVDVADGTDQDGKLGNRVAVNGVFRPTFDVKTGLMRLRVENFSTARQMKLAFSNDQDFYVVAGQQGFLSTPRKIDGKNGLVLAPAEGVEIIFQPNLKGAKVDPNNPMKSSISLISREFTPDNGLYTSKPGDGLNSKGKSADDQQALKEGRPVQGTGFDIMKFNVDSTFKPEAGKSVDELFGPNGSLTKLQERLVSKEVKPRSIAALEVELKSKKVGTRSFDLEGAVLSDGASALFDTLYGRGTVSRERDARPEGTDPSGLKQDQTKEFDELVQKGFLKQKDGEPGEFEMSKDTSVAGVSNKAKAFFDTMFMKPTYVTDADIAKATQNAADVAELKKAGNLVPAKDANGKDIAGKWQVRDLARTINGQLFDLKRMDGDIKVGSREVWTINNPSDMPHPFHIHGREFRIVDVKNLDGSPVATNPLYLSTKPGMMGEMADTINLAPGQTARVEVDFKDAKPGEMLMVHCHNLEHEDGVEGHGMMTMFNFVGADKKKPSGHDMAGMMM